MKQIDSTKPVYDGVIDESTLLMSDFNCSKNGAYFEKNGFWDFEKRDGDMSMKYYGWDSRYENNGDIMKVFIPVPVAKGWSSFKIHSLKGDTLIYAMGDKKYCLFKRQHYKLNQAEQYDAIVVSSGSCYGSCPISTAYVSNKGQLFFEGRANTTVLGSFTANIGTQEYKRLQDEFKKTEMPYDYDEGDCVDAQLIVVSFIKDGKIAKTTTQCAIFTPTAFSDAYNHVLFLYQTVKLTKLEKPSPELEEWRYIPGVKFRPLEN